MRKARTIFGSSSEKRAFEAITAQLPEGWTLFPNVPLPQIIEAKKNELKNGEWDFYLKTSIDCVLPPHRLPSLRWRLSSTAWGKASVWVTHTSKLSQPLTATAA